jgi:hypothetical protein
MFAAMKNFRTTELLSAGSLHQAVSALQQAAAF